jgi:hypothetical protein
MLQTGNAYYTWCVGQQVNPDWGVKTGLFPTTYNALISSLIYYAPPVIIKICDTAKANFVRIEKKDGPRKSGKLE